MPDIAMCKGKGCKKKETCYRFKAKPCPYQQTYMIPDAKNCEHYWETDEERERKK